MQMVDTPFVIFVTFGDQFFSESFGVYKSEITNQSVTFCILLAGK